MRFYKYSMLAILFMSMVRCGGEVGPLSAASGIVTAQDAQKDKMRTETFALITNLMTSIENGGGTPPGGVTTSSFEMKAQDPFDGCTTITPAQLQDADQDGIVVLKKYVYDCKGIIEGTFPVDKVGTATVQDLDDNTKTADGGGYSYEYNLNYFSDGAFDFEWKGFYRFEKIGQKHVYTSQFKGLFTETHSGQDITGGYESNYTYEMTPTDAVQPWFAGTSKTEGFYRMIVKGDDGQGNILDWDFTFKVSGTLVYENTAQSGCRFHYRDGYFEFTDEANNVFRYTYDCNSYTYSFNGQVLFTQR